MVTGSTSSPRPGRPAMPAILHPWVWRMAWRDSRTSRRRLLLFSSSIMLGIAALVAIESFGRNLRDNIENQSKTLLGADLEISSRRPFTDAQEQLMRSLDGATARGATFASMLLFPRAEQSRLVQVKAVESPFPFYGEIETDPPAAAAAFRAGEGVLLEPVLMSQYGVAPGEEVRLGEWTATVAGALTRVPGSGVGFADIAPRVYMPYDRLPDTKLLEARSLVEYQRFFRFGAGVDAEERVSDIKPALREQRLGHDTVERRKRNLGRAMRNLYHFLNLAGFVALILGSVGIGSAIHVHVKQKLSTVAILRCLGASSAQMFSIYLLQALALGLIGTFFGTMLGLLFQQALPFLVADFVPFAVTVTVSGPAILKGAAIGFVISGLFALMPLLGVRRIAPLAAIRAGYETGPKTRFDPSLCGVYAAIGAGVAAFAISQTRDWKVGIGFAAGLAVALGLLSVVAKLITVLARRGVPAALPYVWRQGLANLYRPHNRTLLMMLALGLGTFLVLSLYLSHHLLLRQLFPAGNADQPNAILFEIYQDQKEAVAALLTSLDLPVLQEAPIVNMKLSEVKGVPVTKLPDTDEGRDIPRWVLRRDYRSSYRDHLVDGEELVAGRWVERFDGGLDARIPISLEEGIARDLGVTLGDTLTFDVQGLPVTAEVASLRRVEWRRLQPNFFVVFPRGVLEDAPGFHILATRVASPEQSAEMQRAVVGRFSNVSIIDLTLVLRTLDDIFSRVSFVVRFMALLTVATGLLVLTGAVLTGKYQRVQESVLLRALGASRRQIQRILFAEYLFLGLFGGLTGAVLSVGGSWALARFVFKIDYALAVWPLLIALGAVTSLVIVTGLLANRGVVRHPPLQVLRSETGLKG